MTSNLDMLRLKGAIIPGKTQVLQLRANYNISILL